jgi:hypothetical protein
MSFPCIPVTTSRALMALSTISPALILVGLKQQTCWHGIFDYTVFWSQLFWGGVAAQLFPIILFWSARRNRVEKALTSSDLEKQEDNVFVYMLAIVLPLWDANVSTFGEKASAVLASSIGWFLVAACKLHHCNLLLRILGYNFYRFTPHTTASQHGASSALYISKKPIHHLTGDLTAVRVDDSLNLII